MENFQLSELINLIGGGTPRRSESDYWNGDIPWLSVKDFNNDSRFVDTSEESITQLGFEKSSTKLLNPGMIIISARGTVGELAQLKTQMAFNQSCYGIDANSEYLENDYLYYLLKIKIRELKSIAHGSVFDTITRKTFENIFVDLPSKIEQKKISSILGALDKKIELNQKMNETLEEIAKTLFKSWFIDFDPVRAKAEGRSTGLSKEISDLFPDSFEDSELGEIPMGWSKSFITDIAYKISDKYKKDEDWSNEKLIDLSRMPLNSVSLNSYGRGDELSTSVCKFKKYDFLFGSIRPYFYKAGICPYDGVSNTSVFILRAKKTYDREFIYCYSSSEVTFEKSVQYSDGTKMPIIKWKDFKEFQFAMPNEDIRKHFSSIINPIVEKIICNIEGQEILSKLRDTLLPKLISGELKIPDAENLVEEAGI